MIPTYNERENVEALANEIIAQRMPLDILFIDDNSPDGTGKALDALAKKNSGIKVLHRSGKLGIGSAHQDGIAYAYDRGYSKLITMDCDFTHRPSDIPAFIEKAKHASVVVGSRYRQKKSLDGWNILRKVLTHVGHVLTAIFLRLPYDATGAFRLYDLTVIPRHLFGAVSSLGYSFFFESLYILHFNRYTIAEVPIALPARTYGHSKMRLKDAWKSFSFLFSIFINTKINHERFLVGKPFLKKNPRIALREDWDAYWAQQKTTGRLVYDAVAAFYRKVIIINSLNYFIRKYFPRGADVVHAGCGSGQVDTNVVDLVSVTALDISPAALSIYNTIHHGKASLVHGSIFDMPLKKASMDGIYNLGVMEHFTEGDIAKILKEFYRVLKPKGRVMLFWPPEFGMSVIFFKVLSFFVKGILGKKHVKFHPDEISRIRSKRHAYTIMENAGYRVIRYSFGIRDMFTYAVIVAEKAE